MLLQIFYILFFYFLGEVISTFIHSFIPGSVIGMVLLFLALAFKIIDADNVKKVAKVLTDNMGLFFLPAGVGLMTSINIISNFWPIILLTCLISTILVIAAVALTQQGFEKHKRKAV